MWAYIPTNGARLADRSSSGHVLPDGGRLRNLTAMCGTCVSPHHSPTETYGIRTHTSRPSSSNSGRLHAAGLAEFRTPVAASNLEPLLFSISVPRGQAEGESLKSRQPFPRLSPVFPSLSLCHPFNNFLYKTEPRAPKPKVTRALRAMPQTRSWCQRRSLTFNHFGKNTYERPVLSKITKPSRPPTPKLNTTKAGHHSVSFPCQNTRPRFHRIEARTLQAFPLNRTP